MIMLVGYNENVADFPSDSVEMRPACAPAIRERLKRLFGAQAVEYLGRGFNNAHHHLIGVPGLPSLVVRRMLAPVDALAKRLNREYQVLKHLARCGYPHAPRPIRRIAPEEVDGSPAYAMTFVSRTSPKLDADTLKELGGAVGHLHRLPVPNWLAKVGPTTEPLPLLLNMCSIWRQYHGVVEKMPAIHRKRVVELIEAMPAYLQALNWSHATKALLHGDFGVQNIVRDDNSGQIVFLDWEFASVSDPALDLMWLCDNEGFGNRELSLFFEGYEAGSGRAIPTSWRDQLRVLRAMCLVELAIWAQSGINDIEEGKNAHFFRPGDLAYLLRRVARIHEAKIYVRGKLTFPTRISN